MKKGLLSLILLISAAGTSFGQAKSDTPKTVAPQPFTSMLGMAAGPLTLTTEPLHMGGIYFGGAASGLLQYQTSVVRGDKPLQADVDNAQVFIQKPNGIFQFYVQLGAYSLPDLGTPYMRAGLATNAFYGVFPQGYLKLAPTTNFSIEAGKLPTLIGAEYTFSFENMNIERGLLWNQENAVNRGVQVNYSAGPLTLAVSYNDGFYSNNYNWLWGSLTYAVNSSNTIALIGGGSTSRTAISTTVTPLYLNNEQIYNVIYTHTSGQWTIVPYLQYTTVPKSPLLGTMQDATTFGGALFISYAIPKSEFSIPLRLEYINSTGSSANGAANLLYGPGSNAWSATITPTLQHKRFFARAELSYVSAANTTSGLEMGPLGTDSNQFRALLELGILF